MRQLPDTRPPGVATEVSLREATGTWAKVAALSFGGPAGQIAVMHRLLVEQKRWISEERFLHALNFCMLLPGPEAHQLAIYVGWLLNGALGGVIAGVLFVIPGFLSILGLSVIYAEFGDVQAVQTIFYGLKPAVVAVVVEAVIRIGRRALKTWFLTGLAAAAFIAIFFLRIPFPLIVLGAGLTGWLVWRLRRSTLPDPIDEPGSEAVAEGRAPTLARSLRVLFAGLGVWFLPVGLAVWLAGGRSVLSEMGLFFSKVAVITFGGAYAVLAYVAKEGVARGWLRPHEMLDGLGMAETTPGPLIQVVQFVGFMGAYRNPGDLTPLMAALLASAITCWVTFVPSFLWIFLGAPYLERARGWKALSAALSAITASVVGVILNLAVWFSLHTLFAGVTETQVGLFRLYIPSLPFDALAGLIVVVSLVALLRLKLGMFTTFGLAIGMGVIGKYGLGI